MGQSSSRQGFRHVVKRLPALGTALVLVRTSKARQECLFLVYRLDRPERGCNRGCSHLCIVPVTTTLNELFEDNTIPGAGRLHTPIPAGTASRI